MLSWIDLSNHHGNSKLTESFRAKEDKIKSIHLCIFYLLFKGYDYGFN